MLWDTLFSILKSSYYFIFVLYLFIVSLNYDFNPVLSVATSKSSAPTSALANAAKAVTSVKKNVSVKEENGMKNSMNGR